MTMTLRAERIRNVVYRTTVVRILLVGGCRP